MLIPITALIAAVIKLTSGGPVLYRQERVGLGGCRFTCLKFRTMKQGACTNGHQEHLKVLIKSSQPMTKLDKLGDARLIRFGLFLRSSGLDELPQILNVLRGDMSLVGPRPCTPFEFEQFEKRHLERFDALPGLTGLWQVSGKNGTTFEKMIELDVRYIEQKSPWLDVWIMLKTPVVLAVQLVEMLTKRNGFSKNDPKPESVAVS